KGIQHQPLDFEEELDPRRTQDDNIDAFAHILAYLSNKIQAEYQCVVDGQVLWNTLEERFTHTSYSNILILVRKATNLRYEGSTGELFDKMNAIRYEVSNLNVSVEDIFDMMALNKLPRELEPAHYSDLLTYQTGERINMLAIRKKIEYYEIRAKDNNNSKPS
ncbi:hypothetical protein IWW38_005200, partial [Coemansia aciculifera]